ncbi:MAG: phosphatase PAP2 family protein [Lachnospiraceae bacterium]|nr:phosphatase PAP2 family protein [Lachnospiraceae bacterium]
MKAIMKAMMKRFEQILPKYAWLPLLLAFALNNFAYFATRIVTTSMKHYRLGTSLDARIPVIPAFIVIYWGAYLLWVAGYCTIARSGKRACLELVAADMIAKLICMLIFLILPTTATRPAVAGSDVFSRALQVLYIIDPADNYFPSIHCLESWACFRGVCRKQGARPITRGIYLVAAVLVFLSTLFLRQHMIMDVIGGVLVFEMGMLIGRLSGAWRLLDLMNHGFRPGKRRVEGPRGVTGEDV